MTSKIGWYISQTLRKVWVRVVSFAALAVLTVLLSKLLTGVIPEAWSLAIGVEAVGELLQILASTMLAVTTFSLAIATAAFADAAHTATPRATALLQRDTTAQNVLATFLGAFVFSLMGLIALRAGYFSEAGLPVLFTVTVLIVAAVVIAFLRWISHLMSFGRMADTLDRVEAAAKAALDRRMQAPYLGGRPLHTPIPDSTTPVHADVTGQVQHIDVRELDRLARSNNVKIWLATLPGRFLSPGAPLLHVDRALTDEAPLDRMRAAVTVGPQRDFDQDPGFGLLVMSEIASRALSPAVNDPGTAVSVLGRMVGILADWRDGTEAEIEYRNVFVPPVDTRRMLEQALRPILRDGAAMLEVQMRILRALAAMRRVSSDTFGAATDALAAETMHRAEATLPATEYRALVTFAESLDT